MTGTAEAGARRADPTASGDRLPSSTTARFAILVLTATAATYTLQWPVLTSLAALLGWSPQDRLVRCADAARANALSGLSVADPLAGCLQRERLLLLALSLAGLLAFGLIALAFYLNHPRRVERHARIDSPALARSPIGRAALDRLGRVCADADATGTPLRFAATGIPRGQAYGLPGRRRVALSLSLLTSTDAPASPEAVLRHELGHIRNRDIDVTYLTVGTWRAFLLGAALPVLVVTLFVAPAALVSAGVVVAVFAAVLRFERAAVLRSREFHADLDATSPGYRAAIRPLADAAAPTSRFRTWWSDHPTWPARLAALDDPGHLYRIGIGEAVAAGLLVGIATSTLQTVVATLGVGDQAVRATVVGVVIGVLLAGVVGVSVWRANFWAVRTGRGAPSASGATCALVGGLLAVQLVVPGTDTAATWGQAVARDPLVGLLYGGVLLLIVRCWIWVVGTTARWWLAARLPSRTGLAVTTAVCGVLMGPWLGRWFQMLGLVRDVAEPVAGLAVAAQALIVDTALLGTVLAGAVLAVLPLVLARFTGSRDAVPTADQAFLAGRMTVLGVGGTVAVAVLGLVWTSPVRDALRIVAAPVSDRGPGAGGLTAPFLVALLQPVLIVTFAVAVAAWPLLGRRSASGLGFVGVTLAAAITAAGGMAVQLVHLVRTACGTGQAYACGFPPPGLAVVVLWLLGTVLFVVFGTAAAVSLVRVPRPATARVPTGRFRAFGVTGTVATAVLLAVLLVPPRVAAAAANGDATPDEVAAATAAVRPGSVPSGTACTRAGAASRSADGGTVLGGRITGYLFEQLTILGSSDDPVAQALAREGLAAFVDRGSRSPPDVLELASVYCAIRMAAPPA